MFNKLVLPVLSLGAGVALAIVIGQRMSTDAMAVVIGVAVGVAASVPTSLLLVALLRRSERPSGWDRSQPPAMPQAPQQPQIVVLDPSKLPGWGQQQANLPMPPAGFELSEGQDARPKARIVGHDDWSN